MYYKLFGVADYKSDVTFIKFKMADPKWRTYFEKKVIALKVCSVKGNLKCPARRRGSGPGAAGETPLCSDQDRGVVYGSNQAYMQLCWSSTQNKFVLICQSLSFNSKVYSINIWTVKIKIAVVKLVKSLVIFILRSCYL
jgi:hypothetical protein